MATSTSTTDKTAPKALNGLMLMAAVVSAVSGLLYGYDTGIISGALLQISKEFGTGHDMEQAIAAGILLGAVIGALSCSLLSERWGRHRTILLICAIFIAGSLLCSIAPTAITLALARVVLGFAVGGATQTVPMYVAELAPASIRGRLVLCFQLAIGVGIVISTLVGASESVNWRVSIGSAAVPALLMLLLQLRLPGEPSLAGQAGPPRRRARRPAAGAAGGLRHRRRARGHRRARGAQAGDEGRATAAGAACVRAGCDRRSLSDAASPRSRSSPASR